MIKSGVGGGVKELILEITDRLYEVFRTNKIILVLRCLNAKVRNIQNLGVVGIFRVPGINYNAERMVEM